ncbi:MAG: ribbon-helix-helix domain-containing protein [Acidobacteriota bacterium]|nr:ribbon-helix-helix domain-containing protein [Acidobacteriota bacterium]
MRKKVHQRLNITLPEETVALLDTVAGKGTRSTFIDAAIRKHVHEVKTARMREALKAGAIANAERDLAMAQEWFHLEEEIWKD